MEMQAKLLHDGDDMSFVAKHLMSKPPCILKALDHRVGTVICDHADLQGRGSRCAVATIVRECLCETSEAAVHRSLRRLINLRILLVEHAGGAGPGDTRSYRLNCRVGDDGKSLAWGENAGIPIIAVVPDHDVIAA